MHYLSLMLNFLVIKVTISQLSYQFIIITSAFMLMVAVDTTTIIIIILLLFTN